METPEYILQKLRQRNCLHIDDKSNDEEFNNMSPLDKLRDVTGWEIGSNDWADQFIEWANDCGFEINESQ